MFKAYNRNTRTKIEIRNAALVSFINFEHIPQLVLVFQMLALNR